MAIFLARKLAVSHKSKISYNSIELISINHLKKGMVYVNKAPE